jgi:hypothetical protein
MQLTLFAVLWPACGWSQAELWTWAAQERGAAKATVAQTPKRLGVRLNLEAVLAADEAVVELTSRGLQLSGLATWVEYDARRLRLLEVRLRDRSDDALLLHYEEAGRVMVVVQRSLVGRLPPVVLRFAVEGVGIVRLRDALVQLADGSTGAPNRLGYAVLWPTVSRTTLLENYPNPFNPSTTIPYRLAAAADVELAVYDMLGQRVRLLRQGIEQAGLHKLEWDGRDEAGHQVAGGVYFYRLRAGDFVEMRRLTLLK